jgi:hypothetical protein
MAALSRLAVEGVEHEDDIALSSNENVKPEPSTVWKPLHPLL